MDQWFAGWVLGRTLLCIRQQAGWTAQRWEACGGLGVGQVSSGRCWRSTQAVGSRDRSVGPVGQWVISRVMSGWIGSDDVEWGWHVATTGWWQRVKMGDGVTDREEQVVLVRSGNSKQSGLVWYCRCRISFGKARGRGWVWLVSDLVVGRHAAVGWDGSWMGWHTAAKSCQGGSGLCWCPVGWWEGI